VSAAIRQENDHGAAAVNDRGYNFSNWERYGGGD
jgi:hypothetical protein